MNTKLTLNLDKGVIDQAKNYAKDNSVSLSKLIENYLDSLTKRPAHRKSANRYSQWYDDSTITEKQLRNDNKRSYYKKP